MHSPGILVRYEAARNALAECVRVDEVKVIRDKAMAMQVYARQAKDTELIEYATEIRLRAERRAGELLGAMEKAKGTRGSARGSTDGSGGIITEPPENDAPTLKQLGITKTQSSKWQQQAAMSEPVFEAYVANTKGRAEKSITTSKPGRDCERWDALLANPTRSHGSPRPRVQF